MILIGSRAVRIHFPDFYRNCNDWDYITDVKHPSKITEEGRKEFYSIPAFNKLIGQIEHLSPEQLYTLKVSHSFWDIHWEKTMSDIHFFQKKNVQLDESLFTELYSHWEKVHVKKKVNLNQDNLIFFNKFVNRIYEHDELHKAIAYYEDQPMFTKLKKDLSKAWINKSMFDSLSTEDKFKTCREEIFVIALERFLIPNDFKTNPIVAYRRSAKILITRLSKGWFPKFIVENWSSLNKPDFNFVEKFKESKLYEDKNQLSSNSMVH